MNKEETIPLIEAIKNEDTNEAIRLINDDVDVNETDSDGNTALMSATKRSYKKLKNCY